MPWEIAKAFDFSAPLSQDFIAKEDLDIDNGISFSMKKNGELVQQGNTSDMVFSFDQLISYVSRFMTLRTGDLIFTGTPAGVGPVIKGDRLEAYIGDKLMLKCEVK